MVAFAPTFNVTKLFFDRAEVMRRIDQGRVRALSRQGAYVRTRARRDVLRRRKGISRRGQPPRIHSKDRLGLKTIFFYYDPRSQTVVVGPLKLNKLSYAGRVPLPQLLEFGGTSRIHEVQSGFSRRWYRRDVRKRLRPGQRRRVRTARYQARPFMSVALEREIQAGTIAESWRNVVRA